SEVGSSTIEVCFQVFEDDGLFGCNTVQTCLATICQDVPLPLGPSQDYTLAIPNGQQSGGTLDFTISYNGTPLDAPNNEICNAIDLGVLNLGGSLGDINNSVYNNFCANSFGEPDPGSLGAGWYNSISVWFTFTTGPDPIPYADLIAISDPSGLGDGLGLQIALFTSSSNTCSGPWTMVDQQYNPNGDNELLAASCLDPNQLYFVLIDGVTDTPQQTYGYFGFGIEAENVVQAEDEPCDAIAMGAIPDGGIVDDNINYSNECATSIGDPTVSSFVTQKTVWFSFEAPTTGHILIESFSVPTIDPIGLQLAVFSSSDGSCSGTFSEVASAYSNVLDHQNLEVSCLNPGQTYWLMIDGDNDNEGTFNFQISDAGEDTPVLDQDIVLCFGETLQVGSSIYDATGFYSDTIILSNGCDSIVNTTLTVLDELTFLSLIIDNASALGVADGSATVDATGGLPPYDYLWSDGQTTQIASNLVGGANYCVSVSDQNACEIDTCFEMPYYTPVAATITDAVLLCNGDMDGELILTPSLGTPPYTYNWTGGGNMGTGTIMNEGDATSITGLSAGTYSVTVGDGITEVVLSTEITEPPLLEVNLVSLTDASCFGVCDGTVEVEAMGGVGGYTYSWLGQNGPARTDLCAGTYTVTVTDANGC
ncbi:MAG: SprB repeat-containing protein, partial [Phaeodactylibacter sp.]|nr:SprB repeat-containing protein [Phaeodactylibacter sp.]